MPLLLKVLFSLNLVVPFLLRLLLVETPDSCVLRLVGIVILAVYSLEAVFRFTTSKPVRLGESSPLRDVTKVVFFLATAYYWSKSSISFVPLVYRTRFYLFMFYNSILINKTRSIAQLEKTYFRIFCFLRTLTTEGVARETRIAAALIDLGDVNATIFKDAGWLRPGYALEPVLIRHIYKRLSLPILQQVLDV